MSDYQAGRGPSKDFCPPHGGLEPHHFVSRSTGNPRVPWVGECSLCRWIDPDSLEVREPFVNEILRNTPQEWEASEGSAESIAVDYVRALERRLTALGGSLLPTVEHPNPVRTLESHAVVDQTSESFPSCAPTEHYMRSIKTFSPSVPYVEQCATCLWVDPASLQWWAEDAIKRSLSERAKRIAIATEAEPFAFTISPDQDLTIFEAIGQALGAASTCWSERAVLAAGEFNGSRAKAVYTALFNKVQEYAEERERQWAELAYELYALACNSGPDGHTKPDEWRGAFERLRDRFHALNVEVRVSEPSNPE